MRAEYEGDRRDSLLSSTGRSLDPLGHGDAPERKGFHKGPGMKKRKKSLKDFLDKLVNQQRSQDEEEARLIDEILQKKPELRNTTAKMLKNKTYSSPFKKSPSKRSGGSNDKSNSSPMKGLGSERESSFHKSGS